jgi:hypothetical protein
MAFGRGFRPDTLVTHDGSADAYLGTAAPSAGKRLVDYLPSIGGVGNQGSTESCVGFAFRETIGLRAAALGLSVPLGSALGIYAGTRQLEQAFGKVTDQPLTDSGSSPALAVEFIRRFGLPSEAAFPFDAAKVCDKLTLADLETADKTVPLFVRGFYAITSEGDALIAQCKQAIDTLHPVALAVCSATGDFEAGNGIIDAPPTPRTTDHMIELIDHREGANGTEFLILNHWSTAWRQGGMAWCTSAFVQAANNFFVIDIGATQ